MAIQRSETANQRSKFKISSMRAVLLYCGYNNISVRISVSIMQRIYFAASLCVQFHFVSLFSILQLISILSDIDDDVFLRLYGFPSFLEKFDLYDDSKKTIDKYAIKWNYTIITNINNDKNRILFRYIKDCQSKTIIGNAVYSNKQYKSIS